MGYKKKRTTGKTQRTRAVRREEKTAHAPLQPSSFAVILKKKRESGRERPPSRVLGGREIERERGRDEGWFSSV